MGKELAAKTDGLCWIPGIYAVGREVTPVTHTIDKNKINKAELISSQSLWD